MDFLRTLFQRRTILKTLRLLAIHLNYLIYNTTTEDKPIDSFPHFINRILRTATLAWYDSLRREYYLLVERVFYLFGLIRCSRPTLCLSFQQQWKPVKVGQKAGAKNVAEWDGAKKGWGKKCVVFSDFLAENPHFHDFLPNPNSTIIYYIHVNVSHK